MKQEGVYFQYWIIFTFHNKLDSCYIDLILLDYWLQNIKYVYIIDNKFISMGICKKEWRSSITIFKRIRLWTSMNLSFKINPIVLSISFFLWRNKGLKWLYAVSLQFLDRVDIQSCYFHFTNHYTSYCSTARPTILNRPHHSTQQSKK